MIHLNFKSGIPPEISSDTNSRYSTLVFEEIVSAPIVITELNMEISSMSVNAYAIWEL